MIYVFDHKTVNTFTIIMGFDTTKRGFFMFPWAMEMTSRNYDYKHHDVVTNYRTQPPMY